MDRQTENTCSQSERNTHAELEYARLVNVRFPEKIAALSHTLELVDEMLMSTPEAIIKAAQTNQLTWLKYLVHEYDPNLSEAVIAAASNGHTEAVMYLLGIINRPEDSSDSSSDEGDDEAGEDGEDSRGLCYRARKAFRKAIVAAATYGHLEVVSCFLPQLVGSGRDPDLLREMHNVTWEVLDIAAANGRLNIVTFAVEIAIEWCYLELYTPTSGVDALRLSIAGGHFHMAQFFLELYQIKWNMLAACEEARVSTCSSILFRMVKR
ncbi:unnamed protein product [Phytophthora lilii]|uniref:Unnamed protein product n=1 Tax=Phytophthora lilii TaxID=2077276 RepID=A0A9W6X154_9STRA|nr:unnamed protein product [Phytophthora lilii]